MKNTFLFEYVRRHKGPYIVSVCFSILSAVATVAPYFLIYEVLKRIIAGRREMGDYVGLVLGILVIYTLANVFHKLSTGISHKATYSVLGEMRLDIAEKLTKLPLGTVEAYGSGNLKERLMDKVDAMEPPLAHVVPEVAGNLFVCLLTLIYLFVLNWKLALCGLAIIPLALIVYGANMLNAKEKFSNYIEKNKILNNVIVEYIEGMQVIKTFHRSDSAYEKLETSVRDAANSAIHWMRDNLVGFSIAFVLIPSTLVTVVPVGGWMVLHESLSLSRYIFILLLNFAVMQPLIITVSHLDTIMQTMVNSSLLAMVMEQKELKRPERLEKELKDVEVVFEHVNFSYEELADKGELEIQAQLQLGGEQEKKEKIPVLQDFNLVINSGSVTALVGPSGSGKSTVTKLIASFYDADGGQIRIGGVPLNQIPLEKINSLISYVSQRDYLFNMSIMDNLRLGDPSKTNDEIVEACKKCGVHDFIIHLENGYDTVVGAGGGHLSGGEKQRITIARAMIKDAPIVIFDEATAYTDPENEYKIQRALSALIQDKTVIIVAHRLSTIVGADRICYLEGGKILAQGTHEELLRDCAPYAKMYALHMSMKEENQ
ncbi:MAG: ABC transporter ATP-binding protein [Tissierellia bacterium]|nr:ABC transporter ATP-binding protein [Tissierellia bacterium]